MIDIIEKLVNDSSIENKSDVQTFLETLKTPEVLTLESILNNEKYTDIKNAIKANEGRLHNKWVEESKKETKKTTETPKKTDNSGFDKRFDELMDVIKTQGNEINLLTSNSKVKSLETKKAELLKEYPKELTDYVTVDQNTTAEQLEKQVKFAISQYDTFQKSINNTPATGGISQYKDKTHAEFLNEKKKEFGIK